MRFSLPLLLVCAILSSCNPCIHHYSIEGAEEFVLDSYQIQNGKFSILEMEGEQVAPLPSSLLREYTDQIDEDDLLNIVLYHPTRKDLVESIATLNERFGFRVRQGTIQLPGFAPIEVMGLTLDQARDKIQALYDNAMDNTTVYIEYRERLHSTVELTGAVGLSQIPVNGRIRLYEVLSIAKIPNNANLFKSYVLRDQQLLPVDLYKLIHQGDMSQNIVMRPRDKIFIASPEAANVMVLGEVGYAQVIPVPAGTISLREAIAAAGGIPFTGDKRCIQIIRGSIACPKIYKLSWNHIVHLPNDSLLLMPGDTVYISERPITKWNRFIDQLLPSSLLIDLGIRTRGVFN